MLWTCYIARDAPIGEKVQARKSTKSQSSEYLWEEDGVWDPGLLGGW